MFGLLSLYRRGNLHNTQRLHTYKPDRWFEFRHNPFHYNDHIQSDSNQSDPQVNAGAELLAIAAGTLTAKLYNATLNDDDFLDSNQQNSSKISANTKDSQESVESVIPPPVMTRSVSNDPSAFVKPKKWHNVQLSKPPNKDSLYKLNSPFLTHSPKLSSDVDRVVPKLVFEHTQTTGTYSNFDQKCLLPIGFGQNQVTENRTKESIITVPTQNDANYNEAVMKNIETVNSIPPHSTELISNNISTVEINTDKGPIENINSVDLEKTVKLASPNVIPEVVPAELPDLFEPLYNDLSSDLAIHQAQENFILALCYIQQYSELSPDQASYVCELFEDAAKVGHIDAAFNAGLCYDPLGAFNHIANDISRAIVFYKQAAFEGHKRAQYRLGLLLLEKVSDAKQRVYFEEGIKWIKKSAEGHFKEAQELVKFFQLKGILV